MGNRQNRQYEPACGFYIRDGNLRPVRVIWERNGYSWQYNGKKGKITFPNKQPDATAFSAVLRALGFLPDFVRGQIVTEGRRRDMLVHTQTDLSKSKWPEMYVDDGVLDPVRIDMLRNLFPDPTNSNNVTFNGATVNFKGKNHGTIVYHPSTREKDKFAMALKKLGFKDVSSLRARRGALIIGDWEQPILTFVT
jgi:hypothetical protein